ncbi:hypothetical protein OSH08_05435 [Kaistia geumhonensis]|uniref:Uncharacterized protein n=1 Tax=Kaistia geumhonensis TaxID=410839 RepID=A0ABU0M5Y4_9HYPH|nr:hypothetical protein [Kaistia geumhonensis]MCX5478435.1 hypothetical protein [Kaistia geumhonensis]MDQ0516347.1 hypothetical protein [Kaistia geumhonensis]
MTGTIESLISGRYRLTAHCHGCNHSAEVDLETMARIYGGAASVRGSADRGPARIGGRALVCQECAGRNTSFRVSPGDLPSGRL